MYDVVIIGTGPAGLSASLFTGRAQLKTLAIGQLAKSQLSYAKQVENYLGFPEGIDGIELLQRGIAQAKKCGADIRDGEVVSCIQQNDMFIIKTADGEVFETKTVIIATGIPIQWAGIKGEKELLGKGVHTCASCDGPMYKNKKVAVIGQGNFAAEDALELTSYTKNIIIISHADTFAMGKNFLEQVKKQGIALKTAKIREFIAGKFLKKIVFADGTEEAYDAAFLACGSASSLAFASALGIETKDNILAVDENCMTSIRGIFAAGNCMGKCRQIAKNVGDGCNAGISVIRYLRAGSIYFDYAKH